MKKTYLSHILIGCLFVTLTSSVFTDLDLRTLSAKQGFEIAGKTANEQLGCSVSNAGDINGDGIDDVIIGTKNPYGVGKAYVIFGNEKGLVGLNLDNLDKSQGFRIIGNNDVDYFGTSVSGIGDFNGDGLNDLIIGSSQYQSAGIPYPGAAFIIFGSKKEFSDIDVKTLSPSQGFKITGTSPKDFFGNSVSGAGDVNGDGLADVIIGSYQAVRPGVGDGIVYVIYGNKNIPTLDLDNLVPKQGYRILNNNINSALGISVSSVGDVNGDGVDDLVIGDDLVGRAYVIFGSENEVPDIDFDTFSNTRGFKIQAPISTSSFGYAVSGAGDVNGDGIKDIVIGAFQTITPDLLSAGAAYILYGKLGLSGFDLNNLDSSQGFKIMGANSYDYLGISVSYAGDINNDNIDDFIVGSHTSSLTGLLNAGTAYVIFGNKETPIIDLNNLSSNQGFKITGAEAGDFLGFSVSYAGDIDADGFDDLIIGAYQATREKLSNSGSVYVIKGGSLSSGEKDSLWSKNKAAALIIVILAMLL